ncbi:MAG: hypothetical protein Kow00109_13090 [Acidobacteriota bacterium]
MLRASEAGGKVRISRCLKLLRCPRCGSELTRDDRLLRCTNCSSEYPAAEGIPRLFVPSDSSGRAVESEVQAFYEAHPFPDYEGFEDLASLIEKAREGVFARRLDEAIPFGTRVLDCGCGTGQLANFLGVAHRTVFGTDGSTASLRLAEEFRSRHGLDNVFFLQMNLFRPVFPPATFDVVICNGVLHHTPDPRAGFRILSRLVRPGGYLVVGLYHRWARLGTDLRRVLFRMTGDRLVFLDPRVRREHLGERRRQAWFADQYRNPHESKHTIQETCTWIAEEGLELARTLPSRAFFRTLDEGEDLFAPEPEVGPLETKVRELALALRGDGEGGFFTVIARRPPC